MNTFYNTAIVQIENKNKFLGNSEANDFKPADYR